MARFREVCDALWLEDWERELARERLRILDVAGLGYRLAETVKDIELTPLTNALTEYRVDLYK